MEKTKKYDVFISFKKYDSNGEKTKDTDIAKDLYDKLHELGYNPFFSEESMLTSGNSQFLDVIDKALDECDLMVQVLTNKDYVSCGWVKHEFDRFSSRVINDKEGRLNLYMLLSGLKPGELPNRVKDIYQALAYDDGWDKILGCICTALPVNSNNESSKDSSIQKSVPEKTADVPSERGNSKVNEPITGAETEFNADPHKKSNTCRITGLKCLVGDNLVIPTVCNGNAVIEIGEKAFSGNETIKSVTIPGCVHSIGKEAFRGCISLERITIDSGLLSVGGYAFDGCVALKQIIIPDTVDTIGNFAFRGCTALKSIVLPEGLSAINLRLFCDCKSLESVTIPSGSKINKIGPNAFSGCKSLTNIRLPSGLTDISWEAFSGCERLYEINIPKSVVSVGNKVFYGCKRLKRIDIPQGMKRISEDTFYGCSDLTEVVIPKSVTTIEYAFADCESLEKVYYGGTCEDWDKISKKSSDEYLINATRYFYSEDAPLGDNRFWHYDEKGNPIVWGK